MKEDLERLVDRLIRQLRLVSEKLSQIRSRFSALQRKPSTFWFKSFTTEYSTGKSEERIIANRVRSQLL